MREIRFCSVEGTNLEDVLSPIELVSVQSMISQYDDPVVYGFQREATRLTFYVSERGSLRIPCEPQDGDKIVFFDNNGESNA